MIDRRRLPLNALRAFEAVAVEQSFSAGADRLSVTQSAISRHIANLEALIGRPLLDRTGRRARLLPAGELLLAAVSNGFDEIEAVLNRLDAHRSLRIHMPPGFLDRSAMDLLRDFRDANPDIAVDVMSRHETGMPDDGTDIAIVFQRARVDDRISDLLKPIHFTPMCIPENAPRDGAALQDFLSRSELLHVRISDMPDDHLWQAYARSKGIELRSRASVTFATAAAAAEYAAGGGGVMLGDATTLSDDSVETRLIAPFDEPADLGYGYYLRMRPEMLADVAVVKFRKWLIERFRDRTSNKYPV